MATSEYFKGADVFVKPDGSVYHLGLKKGQLATRILTVGSHSRADYISEFLEEPKITIAADRLFRIHTGYYKKKQVTIIAIGMGSPMADMLLKEATFLEPNPLAIIRLGTCGILKADVRPGELMVASEGSSYVYKNYCYFDGSNDDRKESKPYLITKPVLGDKALNDLLVGELNKCSIPNTCGLNASGETFYSCQGRKLIGYSDENETIMSDLEKSGTISLEMETHQIFHLAKERKIPCYAAACHIGIVNRITPDTVGNISEEDLLRIEKEAGKACLQALVAFEFPE